MRHTSQDMFAASLRDPATPLPQGIVSPRGTDTKRRFAVYRNNVAAGLVRALESRFPVVARLVGEEFFRGMAHLYVTSDLPRSPILFRYGSGFPDFIEGFAPAAGLPYLADVARLELARGRAYHAADALPLEPEAFAGLDAERLAAISVRLHPSVELMTSQHPVVSIWRAHQQEGKPHIVEWGPEAALVLQPAFEVEVHRLPRGGYPFMIALKQGLSLARSATIAAAEASDFNAVQTLSVLIETRAAIEFLPARSV